MGQPNRGPDYALLDRLIQLEKQVKALSTRDVLANSSITQGGLTVSGGGSVTVNGGGSINLSGGGNLNVTGGDIDLSDGNMNVTNSGSIAVTGTGKVTVDGLALSAVTSKSAGALATNFAVTTTRTAQASASIAVPTGFTTVVLIQYTQANLFLSGSALDYMYLGMTTTIPGYEASSSTGPAVSCQGNSGTSPAAGSCAPYQTVQNTLTITNIQAGTITVTSDVWMNSNDWPAETSNSVAIYLTAFFLP